MGSSGGSSDFKPSGTAPPPPANKITPQGQSTPYHPQFINFLGDTNVPSRGLTPEMLNAIMATQNAPPPGPPPANPGAPAPAPAASNRDKLARMMGRGAGEGGASHSGAGSGGNGGGWGGH
jgi:hypothetical protein